MAASGAGSVVPKETLKIIAESVGITNISDELAQKMASDVEYRLREVAGEAIKFMQHSKRSHLTTEDISHALRLRNVEVSFLCTFICVTPDSISCSLSMALQRRTRCTFVGLWERISSSLRIESMSSRRSSTHHSLNAHAMSPSQPTGLLLKVSNRPFHRTPSKRLSKTSWWIQ